MKNEIFYKKKSYYFEWLIDNNFWFINLICFCRWIWLKCWTIYTIFIKCWLTLLRWRWNPYRSYNGFAYFSRIYISSLKKKILDQLKEFLMKNNFKWFGFIHNSIFWILFLKKFFLLIWILQEINNWTISFRTKKFLFFILLKKRKKKQKIFYW
jgi:hypothetical protein